ncbi:MAG: DUF47 family protein [Candidatus Micrarchaeota archaeon]
MGIRELIIPQEKVFFELLRKQAAIVEKGAGELAGMMEDFGAAGEGAGRIKKLEHEGDAIVHDVYLKLNQSLIAPLDHEDISRLASLYDDVLDLVHGASSRIILYEIKKPTPAMRQFAKIILEQVGYINRAMGGIERMKREEIEKSCIEIHRLENEADALLFEETSKLFKGKDAVEIIKMKEVYETMERATDKCEDVGNVLLDIRMKYS